MSTAVPSVSSPSSATPVSAPPQSPLGRIPVLDVRPCVDHGSRPAKSVVGEPFTVTATVFREGHDAVAATAVLTAPDGTEQRVPMTCTNPGLSHWEAKVVADREGRWSYRVEGWSDPWGTWVHDASIKIPADIDADLMRAEGALVLVRAAEEGRFEARPSHLNDRGEGGRAALLSAAEVLTDHDHRPSAALHLVTTGSAADELAERPL
ncbi:MAG: maltotransferase domain-containing protein, partial [Janibacter sp.]